MVKAKIQKFVIRERLPGRNEAEKSSRSNRFAGAKLKKETQRDICRYIKAEKVEPVKHPCIVVCEYTEESKRRDVDNAESSVKYILDAMQECGVLENDNPSHVREVLSFTDYGKESFVDVTVIEDSMDILEMLVKNAKNSLKEAENGFFGVSGEISSDDKQKPKP